MDTLLALTLFMIFVTAVAGVVIRYRARDKCLKNFSDFFVTAELVDGKRVWGNLGVYHNALELRYPSPHADPEGAHSETSYILYQAQYGDLLALKRFHDELSDENQERRRREIERTYDPNWARRTWRRIRNVFNLLRDAVAQAISAMVGAAKKTSSSALVTTQDARLNEAAKTLLGASASAYEPILEKYIGRRVVLEIAQADGTIEEYWGILKEYTEAFICLLDVPSPVEGKRVMDLVVPRSRCAVRHGAEEGEEK